MKKKILTMKFNVTLVIMAIIIIIPAFPGSANYYEGKAEIISYSSPEFFEQGKEITITVEIKNIGNGAEYLWAKISTSKSSSTIVEHYHGVWSDHTRYYTLKMTPVEREDITVKLEAGHDPIIPNDCIVDDIEFFTIRYRSNRVNDQDNKLGDVTSPPMHDELLNTPGFEVLFALFAIALIFLWRRKKET